MRGSHILLKPSNDEDSRFEDILATNLQIRQNVFFVDSVALNLFFEMPKLWFALAKHEFRNGEYL